MVSAYGELAKALKATHKSVSAFQVALSGADPLRAADLLRDMPKFPTFGGGAEEPDKTGKKVSKSFFVMAIRCKPHRGAAHCRLPPPA